MREWNINKELTLLPHNGSSQFPLLSNLEYYSLQNEFFVYSKVFDEEFIVLIRTPMGGDIEICLFRSNGEYL